MPDCNSSTVDDLEITCVLRKCARIAMSAAWVPARSKLDTNYDLAERKFSGLYQLTGDTFSVAVDKFADH